MKAQVSFAVGLFKLALANHCPTSAALWTLRKASSVLTRNPVWDPQSEGLG